MTPKNLITKEIAELLCVEPYEGDSYLTLHRIVEQLKKVPYIQYPVALHTVDMIPYKFNNKGEVELLLGRKSFRTQFQFLGGFVDPKDSAERAAVRELKEETSNTIKIEERELFYLGSFFIDDYRYKESCHKVSTSLFMVDISGNKKVKHGDDIEEVKWFPLEDLNQVNLIGEHIQLLNRFKSAIEEAENQYE